MITELKPYPEYKESGIPWTPELPATWKTERAKRLFTKMQREVRPEDEVVTCFRDGMVTLRKNRRLRGFTEATAFSGYQGIRKGDLVIHGMDAFAGAIGVSDSDGKGTPVYNVCKPGPGIVAGYYAHTLREMSRSQWILALAKGIRERSTDFRYEMFGNQFVPLPPPSEQAAIVRFLDHWNGRLEKAIRSKRRVIALLQEQKQAIIHRAVTRGLDPNVKLKDSGIPWLGETPAHWEVYRLSFLADFSNGKAHEQFFDPEGEHVCVNARFVSTGGTGIKYCTQNFWPARRGDVLMVMSDLPNGRALARAYLVNDDRKYAVNQRVCRLRPKRIEAGFLAYAANRNFGLLRHDDGSNQTHLSTGDYKTLPIQCPPADEQQEIVRYLDAHVSRADISIARYEREIILLREYRTRLTADVVTGKLDVRAAAAQLPDPEQAPAEVDEVEEETEMEEELAD
jgi:type I restriction enzyme S subunit